MRGGGHIGFSTDPIGVGVHVGVGVTESCIHDISWTNWWDSKKFALVYHWDKLKSWLCFGDLDLIFKVTGGFRYMKFSLKMRYLMNHFLVCHQLCKGLPEEWFQEFTIFLWLWPYKIEILIDIPQTCMDISLWQVYDMISLWWPRPHFQGHSLVSGISFEPAIGFSSNSHR